MKKLFSVFLVVVFALSMVGVAVSANNEPRAHKPKVRMATGTIVAIDAAKGTFTVKGTIQALNAAGTVVKGWEGAADLTAGENVKLGDFEVGDTVTVMYSDGKASSVKPSK
jgi:hypothetical protein